MKDKILILFLSLIFKILFIANTLSEEIKFEANVIEFLDKDKKIIAEKTLRFFLIQVWLLTLIKWTIIKR